MISFNSSLFPEVKGAYIVGGSVRDMIIGRSPADYDIAVLENPEKVAGDLARKTKSCMLPLICMILNSGKKKCFIE